MSTIMKASEFIKKLEDVAKNYKTLYVMGCFGSPLNTTNKKRFTTNHTYNKKADRTEMINAASADTFGFDCVNLIKGILWGWNGDKTKTHGGAKYNTNGVPDINADALITKCTDISTDFNKITIGECLWTSGHVGIYIGDGLAIECTPSWDNKVQITACNCKKNGYHTRTWKKHGKLPYIEYDVATAQEPEAKNESTKIDYAKKKDSSIAGSYKVTASTSLHIRSGAGTDKKSLGTLKSGAVVQNYGYYSVASNGAKWLLVKTNDGIRGFCSARYLKKV